MSKLLTKIFFHTGGKPRAWFKYLVFRKNLNPRYFFKYLVENKFGEIRAPFALWLNLARQNPSPAATNNWHIKRKKIIDDGLLRGVSKISVIHTRQTIFVAHAIDNHLKSLGFIVTISEEMPKNFSDDLYIVICPQIFKLLPPNEKRIVFQMEQSVSPRWFTQDYINILYNSLAVFDYSPDNIKFLQGKGLPDDLLYYIPLSPINNYLSSELIEKLKKSSHYKKCEVLFYGDIKNHRRQLFLKELFKNFDLRVEKNLFGPDLWAAILGAKVVVNIHYYEGALLESTRICECLSLNAFVVSETTFDQGRHLDWESHVRFTPIDDVNSMVSVIKNHLDSRGEYYLHELKTRYANSTFNINLENSLNKLGII